MRIARTIGLFTAAAFGGGYSLFGAPLIFTADEAAIERGAFVALYEQSEIEPAVHIGGGAAVEVPTGSVFSQANADVTFERSASLVGLKFVGRPEKLRYSLFIAQVRRFEIEFASGSATNRFDSTDNGFAFGAGIGGSFVPSSIASVGIGWDLQFRQTRVEFERFASVAGVAVASQELIEDEVQAAVTASRRFGVLSPYLGLKISRWITRLEDKATGDNLRGTVDGASVVAGLEYAPLMGEAGFIEASFFDEESVTVGWGFRF